MSIDFKKSLCAISWRAMPIGGGGKRALSATAALGIFVLIRKREPAPAKNRIRRNRRARIRLQERELYDARSGRGPQRHSLGSTGLDR